jgi:hypothetical protein
VHGPPLTEIYPGGHFEQLLEFAPAAELLYPDGHLRHTELPANVLYYPIGHNAQASPAKLNDPAGHLTQALLDVLATVVVLVPAIHVWHDVLPVVLAYRPSGHAKHAPPLML